MLPESSRHPQCLPIEIPADDPFYRNFNQRCMNFVRTTPGLRPDCNFGYAEQVYTMRSNCSFLKACQWLYLFISWTSSLTGWMDLKCKKKSCYDDRVWSVILNVIGFIVPATVAMQKQWRNCVISIREDCVLLDLMEGQLFRWIPSLMSLGRKTARLVLVT
jgi:hypothetical protein